MIFGKFESKNKETEAWFYVGKRLVLRGKSGVGVMNRRKAAEFAK